MSAAGGRERLPSNATGLRCCPEYSLAGIRTQWHSRWIGKLDSYLLSATILGNTYLPGKSIYTYVWRTSRGGQVKICLYVFVFSFLTVLPLELQRRIVDSSMLNRDLWLLALPGITYLVVLLIQGVLKYGLNMAKGECWRRLHVICVNESSNGNSTVPMQTKYRPSALWILERQYLC